MMIRKIAQSRTSSPRQHGAEILEAALVLPIVLSLIFGMVEFAYYFHIEHTVEAACREAARTACVYTNAINGDGYQATATQRCNTILQGAGIDPAKVSIIYSKTPETASPGDDITVTLSTTWGQVGIRLFGLVSDSRAITSKVV